MDAAVRQIFKARGYPAGALLWWSEVDALAWAAADIGWLDADGLEPAATYAATVESAVDGASVEWAEPLRAYVQSAADAARGRLSRDEQNTVASAVAASADDARRLGEWSAEQVVATRKTVETREGRAAWAAGLGLVAAALLWLKLK